MANHRALCIKLVNLRSPFSPSLSAGSSSRTLRVIGMQRIKARSPRLTVRPSACQPGKVLIRPGLLTASTNKADHLGTSGAGLVAYRCIGSVLLSLRVVLVFGL